MITATAAQADETIRRNVLDQLAWDPRVDPTNIEILVNDGRVMLSGWVPSYASRQFAEQDAAYVSGVVSIRNELAVKYPAAVQMPNDRRIEENIRSLLGFNAGIEEKGISVAVVAGNVVLEGTVPSFWQKVRAEAVAAHVNGVITIANNLSVVPTRDVTDEVIAQDITAALSRTPSIEMNLINVSVEHGAVTISGSVSDQVSRRAAQDIAGRTGGVKEVRNDLVVERAVQD